MTPESFAMSKRPCFWWYSWRSNLQCPSLKLWGRIGMLTHSWFVSNCNLITDSPLSPWTIVKLSTFFRKKWWVLFPGPRFQATVAKQGGRIAALIQGHLLLTIRTQLSHLDLHFTDPLLLGLKRTQYTCGVSSLDTHTHTETHNIQQFSFSISPAAVLLDISSITPRFLEGHSNPLWPNLPHQNKVYQAAYSFKPHSGWSKGKCCDQGVQALRRQRGRNIKISVQNHVYKWVQVDKRAQSMQQKWYGEHGRTGGTAVTCFDHIRCEHILSSFGTLALIMQETACHTWMTHQNMFDVCSWLAQKTGPIGCSNHRCHKFFPCISLGCYVDTSVVWRGQGALPGYPRPIQHLPLRTRPWREGRKGRTANPGQDC